MTTTTKPATCADARPATFVLALAALVTLAATAGRAQQPFLPQTRDFLKRHIAMTDEEIAKVQRGEMFAKLLDTPVKHEVAVFGIIWVNVPTDFFIEKFLDIEEFEKGESILAIQKVSDPPKASDFAKLAFPEEDLNAIPNCKVGDCDVKIGETGLLELQKEVNWSAPNAHALANARIRKMAQAYIEEYRKGGNRALASYRDKKRPTYIAREFEGLLKNSPYLPEYIPEFHRFLLDYPNAELPRSENFFYWSTVEFGLKTTVRISHVVLYRDDDADNAEVGIASKMLYGSHYFHTALELRFLLREDAKPDVPGFYIVSLNRSRADGLTGFIGSMLGGTIRRRTRDGLGRYLEGSKAKLEQEYQKKR